MPNFENPIEMREGEMPEQQLKENEKWTFQGKDAYKEARPGTKVKFRVPGQVGERTGEVIGWERDKKDGREDLVIQGREKPIEREWVLAVFDPLMESSKKMSASWKKAMLKGEKELKAPLKIEKQEEPKKPEKFSKAA